MSLGQRVAICLLGVVLLFDITMALTTTSPTTTKSEQSSSGAPFQLGFVTDVEGNLEYFLRWVKQSNVVTASGATPNCKTLHLDLHHDNCHFVYGGDVVDKGPGDIRLTRALVDFQRRYPDRVHLLVGNRDLNKLRFTAELSETDLARPASEIPPPHWDPKAPTLKEFLQQKLKDSENPHLTIENLNTRVNRLHYLLQHTLGCPRTFEFRRQELALLQNSTADQITDHQVVDNFLHEVQQGSLAEYLSVAKVAVCIGNTLFCHGAVDADTMRYIPRIDTKFENPTSKPPPGALIDNVHDWTDALNEFLQQGLEDFRARPHWNDERTSRGGESLMALQNRPAVWGRSIVSNCYGDGGCITTAHAAQIRNDPERVEMSRTNPLAFEKVSSDPLDPMVANWLKKDGIQRVMVGHKPTGDCAAILSALYTGVEIISADTSFSDTTAKDNRGQAVAGVELVGKSPNDNQLRVSGTLSDGMAYTTIGVRLHPDGVDASTGDIYLGLQLEDGWWIKASDQRYYHLTRGNGRKVEHQRVARQDLPSMMNGDITVQQLCLFL